MSLPPLDEWVDTLCAQHEKVFQRDPRADLLPMCLIEREGFDPVFCMMGFNNSRERSFVLATLRHAMAAPGVLRYSIWHEAWTVAFNAPTPEAKAAARAIAAKRELHTHPDRVEVVWTMAVDRHGLTPAGAIQKIIRDDKGRVRRLERLTGEDAPSLMDGDFATLFPQPTEH